MQEKIVVLFTNLCDAKAAREKLNDKGFTLISINATQFGLSRSFHNRHRYKSFPGAILSTVIKIEAYIEICDKSVAEEIIEKSFGVIDYLFLQDYTKAY